MRNIFKTVPGSRTLLAMIIMLTLAVITMGISVFADGEEAVPADTAAEVETAAVEEAPEATEEAEEEGTNPFFATIFSLLPPVIAIVLALITKEVYSSLFIGIFVGGLLAANFNPAGTIDAVINDGFISSVSGSAGIFIFLVLLGVLVALLNRTGASAAFGQWAKKNIKSRIGATLATFLLGVL
ncbi:MAG: Na+/H+ antiporter NhaC family protein, partial [Clostridia bacterium]|nr:Na+/H+ antiporter NhaC family protein [Clostridia bacterium]